MLNLGDGLTMDQIRDELTAYQHQNGLSNRFATDVLDSLVRFVRGGYAVYNQQNGNASSLARFRTRQEAEKHLQEETRVGRVLICVDAGELAHYVSVETYLASRRADIFSQEIHAKVVKLSARVAELEKAVKER